MKYRIFFDADEVLMNFNGYLLEKYNSFYNKNLSIEDIKEWSLDDNLNDGTSLSRFMDEPGFFKELEPFEDAVEVLTKLINDGHDVYISSACWKEAIMDKYDSFEKHFPFLPFNKILIITDKHVLQGDFMIDDKPSNVEKSITRFPVVMDKPWNRHMKDALRVKNLTEFYKLVKKTSTEEFGGLFTDSLV